MVRLGIIPNTFETQAWNRGFVTWAAEQVQRMEKQKEGNPTKEHVSKVSAGAA